MDGYKPKALMGDRDGEELRVITFHKEGRKMEIKLVLADLRKSRVKVNTAKDASVQPTQKDDDLTMSMVNRFMGTSISEGIGKVKVNLRH